MRRIFKFLYNRTIFISNFFTALSCALLLNYVLQLQDNQNSLHDMIFISINSFNVALWLGIKNDFKRL